MSRAKYLALAGATMLLGTATFAALSTATLAADLPPPLPPPVYRVPVAVEVGGWYLRGDVGVGMQEFKEFNFHQTNAAFVWPASWRIDQKDIGDTAFVGFGIGYAWSNWLRFDVTGEYRMKSKFKVLGSFRGEADFCVFGGPDGTCFDAYDGNHAAWVVMANAYIDLGTWWCLTPFVGAGFGGAYHKFTSVTDVGYIADGTTGFGHATVDSAKWSYAWALHAGVAYNVSNTFKVELAYRYLNFGSIDTPIIDCGSSGCAGSGPRAYYSLTNFDSHDFKLGLRFMLQQDPPPAYPPPLMRKG